MPTFQRTAAPTRGPLPPHGTRARYTRYCHCSRCTLANTIYQRDYRARAAAQWSAVEYVAAGVTVTQPPLPIRKR